MDKKVVLLKDYKEEHFSLDTKIVDLEGLKEFIIELKQKFPEKKIGNFVYGVETMNNFIQIDLQDVITDASHDGYEDMADGLDFTDSDFILAQEHLNKWFEKNKSANTVLVEDCSLLVDISELIEELI